MNPREKNLKTKSCKEKDFWRPAEALFSSTSKAFLFTESFLSFFFFCNSSNLYLHELIWDGRHGTLVGKSRRIFELELNNDGMEFFWRTGKWGLYLNSLRCFSIIVGKYYEFEWEFFARPVMNLMKMWK